ncbi:TIGR02611 family protein [Plantactinospora sp. BC1]|nr:TIGR02611 family protein [Plantactinospora sp. BC1]AVT38007.1 TIGR02611 family protein [Plantactinospora sp. BB1]
MEKAALSGASRVNGVGAGARSGVAGAVEERRYDVPEDERVPRGDWSGPATESPTGVGAEAPLEPFVTQTRRQRVRRTLEMIRANPTGRIALKVFVAVAGAIVVTLGLALIPLPGPGWLIVIGGLGIWAVEFHWAKRLLGFTRRHVQSWARWVREQSLLVRIVLGSVGLVFVALVVWLSVRASLGIDLIARFMHYIATH